MEIIVNGMKCEKCVTRVKTALQNLGATNIDIDLKGKKVSFEGIDITLAISEIEDLGFEVEA